MRVITIAVVVSLLAGCRDSTSPTTVQGIYRLNSIGGQALPVVMYSAANYSYEITGGTITLNAHGTFGETFAYHVNDAGTISTPSTACSGSWVQSGNNLAIQETSAGPCGAGITATWDGGSALNIVSPRFASPALYQR